MAQVKERGHFLALVSFLARSKPKVPFLSISLLRNQTEALATQATADFETASKGKRKYKPGTKLYQVERLIGKRKSLLIRRPDS